MTTAVVIALKRHWANHFLEHLKKNDAFIDEVHSAVAPKETAPAPVSQPKDNHKKPKPGK